MITCHSYNNTRNKNNKQEEWKGRKVKSILAPIPFFLFFSAILIISQYYRTFQEEV